MQSSSHSTELWRLSGYSCMPLTWSEGARVHSVCAYGWWDEGGSVRHPRPAWQGQNLSAGSARAAHAPLFAGILSLQYESVGGMR
jgi:hypothetical protein